MRGLNLVLTVVLVFLIGVEVGHLMFTSHLAELVGGSLKLGMPPPPPQALPPPPQLPEASAAPPQLPEASAAPPQLPEASIAPPPARDTTMLASPVAESLPAAPFVGPLEMSGEARPSLVLIGGAKCGSTDAWNYLVKKFKLEPGQAKHKVKEMWCLAREDHKSVRWCYDEIFAKVPSGALTIDGTPAYIHLYDRHTQTEGNCEMSAVNMAYAAPDAAAVALLRNPVKRSRSEYSWSMRANSAMFAHLLAKDINTQVDVELEYLTQGPRRAEVEVLFKEIGAVDPRKVFDAYRLVLDGYHVWLAQEPERCQKVSRRGVDKVGDPTKRIQIPWCYTWPILIPSFWYPLLLHWRSAVFRPRRAAVVQSEAYYANNGILDQLMPMSPRGTFERGGAANQQSYSHADSELSDTSVKRLAKFFELPNRRLRELLRRLPSEGIVVLPPVDKPGSWWQ